ncbi:carbonic anhydrase [Amylibacter kogurei]|uniref:Carbonic anhydrase n=1 Tax=Paramylibacter kogurei TaxID=1889778 RepID=A0A2G5K0K6_9RHOB|nr:carbonic anhydrase [Amylibacter kogurei]PIB23066.1 carbonic anhydrase [Amylibacter kogurei]
MKRIAPLPSSLIKRYHGWRATQFEENKAWYARLADKGQTPRTMVISCCDSRVHVTSVFGAETGEFFIHRNIANLVPPFAPNEDYHGTSAAIEYAVTALGVTNIIIMGHSLCGGVKGCHDMCSGKAPELEEASSFVGRWMDILRPGYKRVAEAGGEDSEQISALEREGVMVSLENLLTFPFVADRVEAEDLALHGVWIDIRDGHMEHYEPASNKFVAIK